MESFSWHTGVQEIRIRSLVETQAMDREAPVDMMPSLGDWELRWVTTPAGRQQGRGGRPKGEGDPNKGQGLPGTVADDGSWGHFTLMDRDQCVCKHTKKGVSQRGTPTIFE